MEDKNIFDLSVILPVNSSKQKDFDLYYERAIRSIYFQNHQPKELIVVHTDEEGLKSKLESFDYSGLTVNYVENKKEHDFCSQVNLGVENSNSTWISVLEFDDEYSSIWFKNVERYANSYPEVGAFLPLVVDTDEKGMFVGFTNEAAFAVSLNTEMGYLTNDLLMGYQNFQTSGMVLKRELYNEVGGFKPSFKLTFVYEFLLRLTYNSVSIMTIPKIGYKHMNMREGSIFWSYKNGQNKISDKEVSFWIESAKKEHFFSSDRKIKYEPEQA
jgi:GT2 family glycosyltransferase